MKLDLSKISNIEVENVNHHDYPDYCDAFISNADYKGKPMTEKQLDDLNNNYGEFVYESVIQNLY